MRSVTRAVDNRVEIVGTMLRNPTEHKIRLQQVLKWSEPSTKEGPAGITKRQKVRTLLKMT